MKLTEPERTRQIWSSSGGWRWKNTAAMTATSHPPVGPPGGPRERRKPNTASKISATERRWVPGAKNSLAQSRPRELSHSNNKWFSFDWRPPKGLSPSCKGLSSASGKSSRYGSFRHGACSKSRSSVHLMITLPARHVKRYSQGFLTGLKVRTTAPVRPVRRFAGYSPP